MKVGLLLVTHPGIGISLRTLAEHLLGRLSMPVECIEVPFDADLEDMLPNASGVLRRADGGGGVLMLTDLYGSSPSNFAEKLTRLGTPTHRVAGLNLPMLLRCLNYTDLDLSELTATAASGGRLGVVVDHA